MGPSHFGLPKCWPMMMLNKETHQNWGTLSLSIHGETTEEGNCSYLLPLSHCELEWHIYNRLLHADDPIFIAINVLVDVMAGWPQRHIKIAIYDVVFCPCNYDYVMTWKRFQHYWPVVRRNLQSPVDSSHEAPVMWDLDFQTVTLPIIWDVTIPMWCLCNVVAV